MRSSEIFKPVTDNEVFNRYKTFVEKSFNHVYKNPELRSRRPDITLNEFTYMFLMELYKRNKGTFDETDHRAEYTIAKRKIEYAYSVGCDMTKFVYDEFNRADSRMQYAYIKFRDYWRYQVEAVNERFDKKCWINPKHQISYYIGKVSGRPVIYAPYIPLFSTQIVAPG